MSKVNSRVHVDEQLCIRICEVLSKMVAKEDIANKYLLLQFLAMTEVKVSGHNSIRTVAWEVDPKTNLVYCQTQISRGPVLPLHWRATSVFNTKQTQVF